MNTLLTFGEKPQRTYNGPSEILYTIGKTDKGIGWTFESNENTYKTEEFDACKKVAEDIIKELKAICKKNGHESFGFEFKYNYDKRIAVAFVDNDNVSVVNCNIDGTDIRTVFTQEDAKTVDLNKGRIILRADARASRNITIESVFNGIENNSDTKNIEQIIKQPEENKTPLDKIKSFIFVEQSKIQKTKEIERLKEPSKVELLQNIQKKLNKYGAITSAYKMMTKKERDLLEEIAHAKRCGKTSQEIMSQLTKNGIYKQSRETKEFDVVAVER